jgi:hypothetical protein
MFKDKMSVPAACSHCGGVVSSESIEAEKEAKAAEAAK